MGLSELQAEQLLNQGLKACRLGREVLLSYFGQLKSVERKVKAGLVSEADRETEKTIQHYLKSVTPEIDFLGEEMAYGTGEPQKVDSKKFKGRWILDPLDGTTNFVHQFPIFCISLGLEWEGEMVLGIIDVPYLKETYVAQKGKGAFLNGKKLKVSENGSLDDSFLATGFFNEEEKPLEEQLQIFSDLVRRARAIRRPGAAAYDLCMVAQGVFDGFWERGLKPWDSAAGVVLVREAGGVVWNYEGKDYSPYDSGIIAGNPRIVKEIHNRVREHIEES